MRIGGGIYHGGSGIRYGGLRRTTATMAAIQKVMGAGLLAAGAGAVYLQFFNPSAQVVEAMSPEVKGSKLKKTLSAGGMLPQPDAVSKGKLKATPSGSMAVFNAPPGSTPQLTKGGGDPM